MHWYWANLSPLRQKPTWTWWTWIKAASVTYQKLYAKITLIIVHVRIMLCKKKTSQCTHCHNYNISKYITCYDFTCTRWHRIKLCVCVNILNTMCSIVLCSSNTILARSSKTWFLFTSNCDRSYNWAFRRPMPQNCKYDAKTFSSYVVNGPSLCLLITLKITIKLG